ncbi:MAG: peptidylprolyl isomerase, partial [Cyanobacteria bacterium J083]
GMTSEQWHNLLARGIKIQKFKEITWNGELESYFIQRKPQLDQVVYSLIRNHDAGIIQELYFRIQENENSFAQLAMDYSEGEEAKTGGLIGPVEINTPHPKIAQMLKSSRAGQVWAPTRVGDWFVIVRLEKFITAHLDEAMKQRLRDELFQQWLKKQMKTLVSYYESEHN